MIFKLTLFWRIYLYGLLLLAAITVSGLSVIHYTNIATPYYQVSEIISSLIADKIEHKDDPEQLQAELDDLYFLLQMSIAIYDSNGNTIAKAGPFSPDALSPDKLKDLACGKFPTKGILSTPLPGYNNSDAYLLLSLDKDTWHLRLTIVLIVAMLLLALLSYPLTRFVLSPLRKITQTSLALGSGNLSARTELRRSDEVGLLARTIDDMAEQIQKLLKSEKELLANISHEFRSPLARMRVAIELTKEDIDPEEVRSYLLDIENDIHELDQLVNDVLLAVKLEIGNGEDVKISLKKQSIQLPELIDLSAQRFHTKHPDIELRIELDPDLPVVQADPVMIRRVLDNLLDNSEKYGKSSPVSIHASATPTELFVEISDRGAGVNEKDLNQLFVPFFRSDPARSAQGGVGLGLTICKRIIEAHHGAISARITSDSSLAVSFTLPI